MPFFVSTCKSQDADPLPPTTLCKAKNVSEYISEYVSEYTSKYVSEYTSEYISECTSECTSDYVREYISEYVSEYTSEYISEYISEKSSSPNSSHSRIGAAASGRRTNKGGRRPSAAAPLCWFPMLVVWLPYVISFLFQALQIINLTWILHDGAFVSLSFCDHGPVFCLGTPCWG